jgi:c(7)-type cytochrome triheme protein
MVHIKKILSAFIIALTVTVLASAADYSESLQYLLPPAEDFGQVVLDNYSHKAGVSPVTFDHWLHRAKFTCRLCHIDIGFAMKEKMTEISAADNVSGYYCGSCHDGKRVFDGREIFDSCAEDYTKNEGKRCARCHSDAESEARKYKYTTFSEKLPKLPGNLIDWEKAESEGKIKVTDFLEGVSYKREPLKAQDDFSIKTTTWTSDVIFSHRKHTVWNGCELCHPLIFPSTKKGTTQYSMKQIMKGEYCGACHMSVAFSVWLCDKCHITPVKQ